ncbi:MAG TPA: SCP2 sterol-binding domain-containing protein, partial [Solirubrobacterales bacterium]|nr:SCP2 sterol-binding domain-containing protein [Solirubrobacterales bacterium]
RALLAPRDLAGRVRAELREGARRRVQGVLARIVDGASDREVERRFGRPAAQRALLGGMARAFDPEMAFGFEGDIEYELTRGGADGDGLASVDRWTIRVGKERARLIRGSGGDPAVLMRIPLADFVRIAAGESPAAAFFEGRVELEGDLSVARRMAEMFGGPSPY